MLQITGVITMHDTSFLHLRRLGITGGAFLCAMFAASPVAQAAGTGSITLMQLGDLHGHLVARPNLRSDGTAGVPEGGLARMATKIGQIRVAKPGALLINTGDTIHGSAEALFTGGQTIVNVVNQLNVDAFAPGNWDFVYGTGRFLQFFTPIGPPNPPGFPPVVPAQPAFWGAVAANLYYTDELPAYAHLAGQRVLPPYLIKERNGLKIGIIGLTTGDAEMNKQPATDGVEFTTDGHELPELIATLRNTELVDLVVLISEFGLGKNIVLAERYPGIDVVLSSDMHEETKKPVVVKTGTILSEAGGDGTKLAEMTLNVVNGKLGTWDYTLHTITPAITEAAPLATVIAVIRSNFVTSPNFPCKTLPPGNLNGCTNPINGTKLLVPINTSAGLAATNLYRYNYSQQPTPGVLEGTSSALISEAFREQAGTDIGQIRGFRYGNHVAAAGPIRVEDLFHFLSAGAQIAKINAKGGMIKYALEFSADRVLYPDALVWSGGWLNAYAGMRFKFDPAGLPGFRAKFVEVFDRASGQWKPLNLLKDYTYAGYFFDIRPDVVGGLPVPNGETATLVTGPNGERLDATQVVANYLATHSSDPGPSRVTLLAPLPKPLFGNPEIQPLRGVCPRITLDCKLFTFPPLPDLSDFLNP